MSVIKPILRIFDYDKAVEFYVNWLGFTIDWEHKPAHAPLYLQITLRDLSIHLSEHHGDASPGTHLRIEDFKELKAYHQLLNNKNYKFGRPGLKVPEWNNKELNMTVYYPFGNKLTFAEVTA